MISYGHPNCSSCHVAPLGRGLLNGYGRGIDMEQSLAYSNLLFAGDHHFAGRYTLSARLNRNLTVGMTFGLGDLRRNLSFGQEGTVFATVKF